VFLELIGYPDAVSLPSGAMVWQPTDDNLVTLYREAVTGLTLARPSNGKNVIPMGGRMQ
jgi:hypothetical protein